MKHSDDEQVEGGVKPKYEERGRAASFPEILFTRITADLGEKLILELKERRATPPVAAGAEPEQGTGWVSVDAFVSSAEVAVDGHLVGTTPQQSIPLQMGDHVIEVTKKGFKGWRRDVRVLRGETSRPVAELEADERVRPGLLDRLSRQWYRPPPAERRGTEGLPVASLARRGWTSSPSPTTTRSRGRSGPGAYRLRGGRSRRAAGALPVPGGRPILTLLTKLSTNTQRDE